MAANRRMTADEIAYYLRQVERKGRAMRLPDAELEKWKTEYDKISDYLNRNYRRFMVSKIVRRRADVAVFHAFVEAEKDGLIADAREMLHQGDARNFDWLCWLAHLRYMTMVWEKRGASPRFAVGQNEISWSGNVSKRKLQPRWM